MGSSAAIIRKLLQLLEFAETGADMKDKPSALDNACPVCGQPPGLRCTSIGRGGRIEALSAIGRVLNRFHRGRAGFTRQRRKSLKESLPMSEQTPRFTMDKCPDCGADMADAGPPIGFYCSQGKDCIGWKRMVRTYRPDDEIAALSARCTALEQERDQAKAWADIVTHGKSPCGHWSAYCFTESGGKHIACILCERNEFYARYQHLEQAVKGFLDVWPEAEKAINGAIVVASIHSCPYNGPTLTPQLDGLKAALASLLPSQDETSDAERATFSAGYSQAIDDALKGK